MKKKPKKKTPKPRRPQDATLRNIRALKKRLALLEERLGSVEHDADVTATKISQMDVKVQEPSA
jgi:hypothetical protein